MVIARFKTLSQACTREVEEASLDGLRSVIEVDNRSAVDVGGMRRGTTSIHVKKPQFSEAFTRAVIRKGADEGNVAS